MARVALINLASLPTTDSNPVFPVGLRCVADALDRAGHETRLVDFVEDPKAYEDLGWAAEPWDIVGFSIRNIDPIDLAARSFVDDYENFVARVRQAIPQPLPLPLLVGGGSGFSLFAAVLVERLGLDVGVIGAGEQAMLDLAADPEPYRGRRCTVEGRKYEAFTVAPLRHPAGLLAAYKRDGNAMLGVESRRKTCSQACVYCSYAYISGHNDGDTKPLDLLVDELRHVYEAGIRRVFFTDSVFNSDLCHAKAVTRAISESGLADLRWSAFFTPTPFDDELGDLLSRGGVEQVIASPDSFDPGMMRRLGKRFDILQIDRFIAHCRQHRLNMAMTLTFGGPGETRETVRATARYANANLDDHEMFFNVGFRILPATGLARQLKIQPADLLSPVFYPVDPDLFSWILSDVDSRFFSTLDLLMMMRWRRAASQRRHLFPASDADGRRYEGALRREHRTGEQCWTTS